MDRVTHEPDAAKPDDKDIEGLAFHIADCLDQKWERLGDREKALYRVAARSGLATARLVFEAEAAGLARA